MLQNHKQFISYQLGGVYMAPGQLSRRGEFTPVPSHGSTVVYMIPSQNVMPAQIALAWVHSSCRTGARFHSGARFRNGIM